KTLLFVGVFIFNLSVFAQPTEESLLRAWEQSQKSDSKVEVFEKIEDDVYRFKTSWFPFDGKLRVLNLSVNDSMADSAYPYGEVMGVIEIELADLPDDFHSKYSYSYSMWANSNMLYYDKKADTWLSSGEYFSKQAGYPMLSSIFLGYLFSYGPFVIIFVLLVYVLFTAGKTVRMSKRYMEEAKKLTERSLTVNEEANTLLRQILEALKVK
ncbi:hypothetical protein ACFL2W_00930, partial [Candidatus Omnitrophota bacterium]